LLKASSLFTSDALFNGRLTVTQQRDGYRFSVDALLLAGLTRVKSEDRVADLGTGCGVVVLVMAYRKLGRDFVGLEVQTELAGLAKQNVEAVSTSS
jgi:tRNA1Val (adenine37-N6)-methyltransferase